MSKRKHLLIVDPISFRGGSKIATENMLSLIEPDRFLITVLSSDTSSWNDAHINKIDLFELPFLAKQEQGIPYFLRHFWISLILVFVQLTRGRIDIAIGASGPGVDLSLYFVKPILNYKIFQFIHGPIAKSKTIAKCLMSADRVFYLESAKANIVDVLGAISNKDLPEKYQLFENGLTEGQWPSLCEYDTPRLFWAASLLKWKGLDLLLAAQKSIKLNERIHCYICYIKPKDTPLAISGIETGIDYSHWYHNPSDLDSIRSHCNIFVSTSYREPFGLSVLEAMASGHALLIPNDGAYWDRKLIDGKNCIKYKHNDASDLAKKIKLLSNNLCLIKQLGLSALALSREYQASNCYKNIVGELDKTVLLGTKTNSISGDFHV